MSLRLIISLRSLEDQPYEYEYHHHLQGFVYSLIKNSEYSHLHDKEGYKFFCMSNVFPAQDLKKGDKRTLIISSPSDGFIETVALSLLRLPTVKIGRMRFELNGMRFVKYKLQREATRLITGTPIVVRIPSYRYKEYGIHPDKSYEYVFWRKEYPLQVFIKQLEENLVKKYREFYSKSAEGAIPLFQLLKFKKQVSTRIHFEEGTQTVIGTVWEFLFQNLTDEQVELLRFGLDTGFGEMNSKGFGFINPIKEKPKEVLI